MMINKELYSEFVKLMPIVCVDLFVSFDDDPGKILTLHRTQEPLKGKMFPPGGRMFKGEQPTDSACRILKDEVGIDIIDPLMNVKFEFVGIYSTVYHTSEYDSSIHTVSLFHSILLPTETKSKIKLDFQSDGYSLNTPMQDQLKEVFRHSISSIGG